MPVHSKRFSNANLPAASEQAITRDQFGTYCFNTQLLAESLPPASFLVTACQIEGPLPPLARSAGQARYPGPSLRRRGARSGYPVLSLAMVDRR